MKWNLRVVAILAGLAAPAIAGAQSVGQVECPREGGYAYLYSSMTTMEVRTTLQCGEQVQITGRYDFYFAVRTAKGEVGYVPQDSLLLLKDKPGAKATPQAVTKPPARERTQYDPTAPAQPALSANRPGQLTLLNGTPIHLKLAKTISSANAKVGDPLEFRVAEEVRVDGLVVIPEGAVATGAITEAEPKRRMGHDGKLAFNISSVILKDNEKAALRSFQEGSGSKSSANPIHQLASGKDVVFAEGSVFTAYADGDIPLKKASFALDKSSGSESATKTASAQPNK